MPDANGKFRGISVPADAWERIFGSQRVELTGAALQAWIDEPPRARCSSCERCTWSEERICQMTQPNGQPCGGRFIPCP